MAGLVAALTGLGTGLSGCAGQAGPGPAPVPLLATPAAVAERLGQAVAQGDRTGFDAVFAAGAALPGAAPAPTVAPAPAGRRDLLWANLRGLGAFEARTGPSEATLRVGWLPPEGTGPMAWQVVGGVVCAGGTCGLRDLVPVDGQPAPLWAVQPVAATRDPATGAVVLAATGAPDWLDAAARAAAAVSAADLAGLRAPHPVPLVVEVPDGLAAFQAVLGTSGADLAQTGALTWVEDTGLPPDAPATLPGTPATGSVPDDRWVAPAAAVHVVVNPTATAGLTASRRAMLLAHEAVHVVTAGRPVAPGRLWVSEGVAELVALGLDPATAAWSATAARSACGPGGLTPPPDAAFHGGDAAAQRLAYAVGWQLLALLRDRVGAPSAQADVVALWEADPTASPGIASDLAAWSAQWCAGLA